MTILKTVTLGDILVMASLFLLFGREVIAPHHQPASSNGTDSPAWELREKSAARFAKDFGLTSFEGCVHGERLLQCSGEKLDMAPGFPLEVQFECDERACRRTW